MSQHAVFWTLPALDTGQTVPPMVSGSHPSSAHRPFGSNHLMTQPQTPPPPPPPLRQRDMQKHLKTQPPSEHATYVNCEQRTFWMIHGPTMPICHTDPSCSVNQHSRSKPSDALGSPQASPLSTKQPPATKHSHSWQETTQAPLLLPTEPYYTKRLKQQPSSQLGLAFPGSIIPRPSMSHLMSYGNISDPQAQISAPPFHQQLYRHMTSLSSDHPTNCSEMLTHELSKPQQPNLIVRDACSQHLPGTSGSPGIPEPLAVHARPPIQHCDFNANAVTFEHARAPVQHYDFNVNAISFEPLSLKRGAAAPNAQQTFQHTSGAPLCREGQATKSQTSNKTSSARRQPNQKSGTKVPG